ncbi:type II secretion system protein [Mycetocola manganoxydans]|uniref:Type II secretion system protein n=1 Tax=Mycetocola manganoxydans TaxID=699879 RepID=A0A3L6ZVV0_9MICO|nr:type II secretion system protein [Mycetocola manganoxydans]RLP71938.1 type II secretion system protein [Mycetocola manganoxydans]GHD47196.1 hypothetical protein GCM10008097_17820 [Mycetocola manganoxydans]
MAVRTRVARARTGTERGITMVELLVAMLLLSIVMTVVIALLSSLTKAASMSQGIDASSKTASNAMNELALVIRNGASVPVRNNIVPLAAFAAASPESMTIHSVLSSTGSVLAPVKVGFTVNAQRQLIEQRWTASVSDGYYSWPASATVSTRNLSGSLLIPEAGGTSLFTYLDSTGTPIPMGAGNKIIAANLEKVRSVIITMRVEAEGGAAGEIVELVNTVGVPNLGEVRTE